MKKTGIIADSHSGVTKEQAEKLGIRVLPMPFYFDGVCFYEGEGITRDEGLKRIEGGEKVTTTQPTPEAVMEIWDEALSENDEILYFPISSGLSGSCNTAMLLSSDDKYAGRVFVVDNGRISVPQVCSILDSLEMIKAGKDAAFIKNLLESKPDDFDIYVGVEDIKYLQQGGRISAASAFIGKMLSIKPMLRLRRGLLEKYKECRGSVKLRKEMIACAKASIEEMEAAGLDKNRLRVISASCLYSDDIGKWTDEVQAAFPDHKVIYGDLSLGIACHLGPGGIGVGFSFTPEY